MVQDPELTVIEQPLVGAARETARRETARRVAPLLTPERCRWHDEMDKLVYLRDSGPRAGTRARCRPDG